jgi:DNA-binding HxlR family transcriptional regulator
VRLVPSSSKKNLRASLCSLESARIVVRRDLSHDVHHAEYDFAEDMRDAVSSVLDHLAEWGTVLDNRVSSTSQ